MNPNHPDRENEAHIDEPDDDKDAYDHAATRRLEGVSATRVVASLLYEMDERVARIAELEGRVRHVEETRAEQVKRAEKAEAALRMALPLLRTLGATTTVPASVWQLAYDEDRKALDGGQS